MHQPFPAGFTRCWFTIPKLLKSPLDFESTSLLSSCVGKKKGEQAKQSYRLVVEGGFGLYFACPYSNPTVVIHPGSYARSKLLSKIRRLDDFSPCRLCEPNLLLDSINRLHLSATLETINEFPRADGAVVEAGADDGVYWTLVVVVPTRPAALQDRFVAESGELGRRRFETCIAAVDHAFVAGAEPHQRRDAPLAIRGHRATDGRHAEHHCACVR